MNNDLEMFNNLETIITALPGHVYWLDRDNIYRGCNDIQAKAFGLNSSKEIIGKRNEDLPAFSMHPEVVAFLNENNLKVMRENKVLTLAFFQFRAFNYGLKGGGPDEGFVG